jgi:hypothetical protein
MRADTFSPADSLTIATEGGARCVERDDLGQLTPGAPTSRSSPATISSTYRTRSPGSCSVRIGATHVLVDGRFVVRDGEVLGIDLQAAYRELVRGNACGTRETSGNDNNGERAEVKKSWKVFVARVPGAGVRGVRWRRRTTAAAANPDRRRRRRRSRWRSVRRSRRRHGMDQRSTTTAGRASRRARRQGRDHIPRDIPEGARSEKTFEDLGRRATTSSSRRRSFGYGDPIEKVAPLPDTVFMHATGYKTAENVGTYFVLRKKRAT